MKGAPFQLAERLLALVLLIVLAPVLAALSVVLLTVQGRPLLFAQERAGQNDRPFTLLKFRTMRTGATGESQEDRVTSVGRVLRRYGLDELPQLLNIVRGEMSFIGPRPTLAAQTACYGRHERRRLDVRPGITGWAQVHGRNAIPWEDRIALDIWYVENRSVRIDLKILRRTVRTIVSGNGVYGNGGFNPDYAGGTSVQS